MLQLLLEPTNLLILLVTALVGYYLYGLNKSRRYPPGPRPWPIVGNIPYVRRLGKFFFEIPLHLRQKYGDIISLQMGPSSIVVFLMGHEKIHKAGVEMNDVFKYRPNNIYIMKEVFKMKGVLFSNGDTHSAIRKFTLGSLRDFGVGKKSLEQKIQEEAEALVSVFEKTKGKPYMFLQSCKLTVANVIASIVYGNRFDHDDKVFTRLVDNIDFFFRTISVLLPENYFPFLRHLPGSKMAKGMERLDELARYAGSRIQEHRETFDPDNIRDFVDLFIQNERDPSNKFTEEDLFRVIIDLFNAGTDTTATTLVFTLVHLVNNPDVQEKCRKQIREVVGDSRYINLEDKKNLPYLEAVINETLRFSTIAPNTVPHTVLQDTDFEGYVIPKGALVFFHIYSLLMDPETWGDPEVFRPERFLDESGGLGHVPEAFKPFSLGGRSCLGKYLARMELFIFLGTLLQRFEFKPPPGVKRLSDRRIQSGVVVRPEDSELCAIPLE